MLELTFTIEPVGGATVSGSGTITPGRDAGESAVNLQWQGLPLRSTHAVSQFHGASIRELEPAPEFVFAPVTADGFGKAAALVYPKKPFWRWANRPHFIVIHRDTEITSEPLGCGVVVATPAEVGLLEMDHGTLRAQAESREGRGAAAADVPLPAKSAPRLRIVRAGESPGAQGSARLSRREQEILDLVAAGKSNLEIADALVISVKTVERHVANVYTKIGAHNRVNAANYRHGQLGP